MPPQDDISPQDESTPQAVPDGDGTHLPVSPSSIPETPADPDASDPETDSAERVAAHLTGQIVGAYRVEERLGGGAHSSVYRAVNTGSGDIVALKVLLPGADGVARARFRHEAQMAIALEHPHIVKTQYVGQTADDDVAYIALELVDGISLSALLQRQRQLSVLDACTLLGPIAAAIAYAHHQGVIHRDVKPSNILLRRAAADEHGAVHLSALDYPVVPLLTDFGIARALDAPELTHAGRTIGTPAYMAPEQCEGDREIDGRADIYSLGAVLYRCLVGRPPFGGTTTQILYAHVYNPLTIPDRVLVELPVHVVNILKRALAKEPRDRYPSAEAIAGDLAQISGRYTAMSQAAGVSPDEATRTMSSLPAMRPQTDSFSVLVPGTARPTPEGTTRTSRTLTAVAPTAPQRRISIPWLAMGIVGAAMLVIIGFGYLLRNTPGDAMSQPPADAALPTDAAVAVSTPGDAATPPEAGAPGVAENPDVRPTLPIPAISVASTWEDAVFLGRDQDWELALDQIVLILRTDPEFNSFPQENIEAEAAFIRRLFLDDPTRPFWSAVEAYFGPQELAAMLFDIYVGVATNLNAQNRPNQAREYFQAALAIEPEATEVGDLLQATVGYDNALPTDRPAARNTLQLAHIGYADELEADALYCAAAEQIDAANGMASTPQLVARLAELEARCVQELALADGVVVLEQLAGRLIYASRHEGRDRIFAQPAAVSGAAPSNPTALVEDALYGSLSTVTNRMALYSTRINAEGLFGFDIDRGLSPLERVIRFTRFAEDGAESPASWDPRGERLAFASRREGDKQSRVYVTWADGEDNTRTVANGGDPAWHPAFDRIVYSGVDVTGNRPGLWQVDSQGGSAERLTFVETDIRPQWSPGGQYIVFTSLTRHGNWEIYRLDVGTGELERMTNDAAQDVLPAVDPEGEIVAFLSDRSGAWAIWAMPLAGGDPVLLAPVTGEISAWQRSSLQWVP